MKHTKKENKEWKKLVLPAILIIGIILVINIFFLISQKTATNANNASTSSLFHSEGPAIELVSPDYYHNLNPGKNSITISEFIGKKVILVDFWTYSCINCQRTLPFLNAWYEKYKDQGLQIISVHTPEFNFEKDFNNVEDAIKKYGVKYPVVQDNEMQTWRAYQNSYWPRKYLIDIHGNIVYDHIGEGNYDETESVIQKLLEERAQVLNIRDSISTSLVNISEQNLEIGTPEIYAGYLYNRGQLGNSEGFSADKDVIYSPPAPQNQAANKFYLSGAWLNNADNMQSMSQNATIELTYYAKQINIVAGSATNESIPLSISIDGIPQIPQIRIGERDLYTLFNGDTAALHKIVITTTPGLEFYTFTFG